MKASLVGILACPQCQRPLTFDGTRSGDRLTNGVLECTNGHLFNLKAGVAFLKKPERSRHEYVWKVKFPNIEKYDRIRRQYVSYLSKNQVEADELLVHRLARKAPRNGIILDLASGMGTLLLALSSYVGDRAQVMGTDVDETPLRGAMLKLKQERSYGRVSLCVMDARRLAVKPNRLSCITSYFGFNNIPQPKRALSEAFRVMTRGGRLIIGALFFEEDSRSFKEAVKLGLGDVATETRLAAALEKTGFRVDSTERFYSGKWPHNPMDRLPLEGDSFAHSLVEAVKG